ncbi:MAG: tryptophan--tRNA ligase [Bacillales bacterium]|jgi:tryptophanyl-tRNA synthetase|nr:tryptophan--tRNA ligase [Bacillales bacterium]
MKKMISGIKPSGSPTLGNYIGAIKNFVHYQNEYELYVFIADLHAITIRQDPLELKRNTLDIATLYIACGLNPNKCTIFVQTDVLEHANLGFILNCFTYMGELTRMTQFKEKSQNTNNDSIGVGLFTYPPLMAADILLYDVDYVPVGEDQVQHLEITRDIAIRINNLYNQKVFVIPDKIVNKVGARIKSLQDPSKKMSKSEDPSDKGCIFLLEDPNKAYKKIMSAVTDNEMLVKYDPDNKPGISNLIQIYCSLKDVSIETCEEEFKDSNYGTFKKAVAEIVKTTLENIQSRFKEIRYTDKLAEILNEGKLKAQKIASKKLLEIEKVIGLK